MLTGDAHFPVEARIVPLVYQMKRSGWFEPCWSCEGHEDAQGVLSKPPTVWFYCAPAALRLLARGLASIRTHARWRIAVTHSDNNNPAPTFALEAQPDGANLGQLQADVATIAMALPSMMRDGAQAILGELQATRPS